MPEWLLPDLCGLVIVFVLFDAFVPPPNFDTMTSQDPPDAPPGVDSY